ncbi:MAG: hypothetical protein PHC88_11415 [Terrimicrobiaceae bacterium]|nr:hypothetical protein [Terrimicrobiaceae bacterium]
MDSLFWERLHGGATHFPIALVLASAFFDAAAFLRPRLPEAGGLRATGRWLLLLGAAGSLGAVFSGLALSKWVVWGTGTLLRHHLFVWPAFALVVGLAAWRLVIGNRASRRAFAIYLLAMALACALISAAGFFGGEMLLGN